MTPDEAAYRIVQRFSYCLADSQRERDEMFAIMRDALSAARQAGAEAMQEEAHRVAGVVEFHDCPNKDSDRAPCLDCAFQDGRQAAADAIRALPLDAPEGGS